MEASTFDTLPYERISHMTQLPASVANAETFSLRQDEEGDRFYPVFTWHLWNQRRIHRLLVCPATPAAFLLYFAERQHMLSVIRNPALPLHLLDLEFANKFQQAFQSHAEFFVKTRADGRKVVALNTYWCHICNGKTLLALPVQTPTLTPKDLSPWLLRRF